MEGWELTPFPPSLCWQDLWAVVSLCLCGEQELHQHCDGSRHCQIKGGKE